MVFSEFFNAATPHFSVEIDGVMTQTVTKIEGLSMKIEAHDAKSVNSTGIPVQRKIPGNRAFLGELKITRLFTDDKGWAEWWKSCDTNAQTNMKNGTIVIYNQARMPAQTFTWKNGWCSSYDVSGLDAGASSPVTETIGIFYDQLDLD